MDWKGRLFEIFISQKVLFTLVFGAITAFVPLSETNAGVFKVLIGASLGVKAVDYIAGAVRSKNGTK